MNRLEVMFTTVLNMSITASFIALGVILVRLMLRKMPKIFSYALWSAVFIRLVFPVSFTSIFSLLTVIKPATQQTTGAIAYVPYNMGLMQTPGIDIGVNGINKAVNSSLPQAVQTASVNPMQIAMAILSIAWVVGVALLILYSVISYLKVINNVKTSTLVRDNIFETDRIVTPFVCGFIKPKIYIPTDISQNELPYILAHEKVHIKRLDYLIKPFAFLVLSVHWFNPLMWLSFYLMSKDLEMSCDESVLKRFGDETRVNYSQSLLALATGKRQLISGSPLAFGESNTKARIKNVLSYKKPPFWVVVVALIITFALVILFTANPKNELLETGVYSGYKMETLMANKTPYVGDNSKVVALLDAMPLPTGVVRDSVELQTAATPYSMTIHYTVSKLEGLNNTYAFHNAIMLFSLVDNVDVIYSSILDITNSPSHSIATFPHTREYADQLMEGDVRDYASNTGTLITFIDRINSISIGNPIIPPDSNNITAQGPYMDQIEKYLATIMSSPQLSSNPQDYIKAHENEYNAILDMDHKALTYLFSQFKKGGQNGLKGNIMMNLCRTILGGEDIKSANTTPQDWYDTYKDYMQTMVIENGVDWVHQNAPKGSLIRL